MARQSAPEPTDARIVDLAADHIRRFGVERTTIVSIARAAGMSHANIYRYFPSKEALIDAVTAHWLKPLESGLRDIVDAPDPAYDKLERLLAAIHRAYREKLETDRNIFDQFAAAVTDGRGIARKHRNRVQLEVARVIEEGMSGGAFEAMDQRRAMALVFDALHRFIHPICIQMDAGMPRPQVEIRFERVLRLVRRGLGAVGS